MKRVILHIDRLVLRGFRHVDRHAVSETLRDELQRQFASPDAVHQLVSAGYLSRLNAGEVRIRLDGKQAQACALAANGIARKVKS